jgi:hypothetical protein
MNTQGFIISSILSFAVLIGIALAASSCDGQDPPGKVNVVATTRFTTTYHGSFSCGQEDRENRRTIYVVTDVLTGVEYLAIQGCGTSQLVVEKHGKSSTKVER